MRTIFSDLTGGGGGVVFPVKPETTPSHVFTKEVDHAGTCSQYANGNFYCENCLRVFSTMTGKLA